MILSSSASSSSLVSVSVSAASGVCTPLTPIKETSHYHPPPDNDNNDPLLWSKSKRKRMRQKEKKLLKNIDSSSFRSANYLSNSYHSAPQGVECIHAQVGRSVGNHNVGVEQTQNPPTWVHVFKSPNPSSTRTQGASIAHIAHTETKHPKAIHQINQRAKKKLRKQQECLVQVNVPNSIKQQLLSEMDLEKDIVVVDGGDVGNPPIQPPDGVTWHCLSVRGSDLYVQDVTDPSLGLTFTRIGGDCLPFIRMPRGQSLDITGQTGMGDIISALEECEKLKSTSLKRSDNKRVFGDYGTHVQYTSAGVQVDRNSREVLPCNAFMKKLPEWHWKIIMKLMRRAERAFESIVDHQVLSHMHHAMKLVPFKTMSMPSDPTPLKYYGALAFGCNVFLQCHTDDDFTMSMIQVHLKGKDRYDVNDDIVVYFCFPTLGCAVPLRPGDFLIFNALIPHCVSSRCRQEDDIMITSAYLKTSVVGMNNNKLPVTSEQSSLADKYRNSINN